MSSIKDGDRSYKLKWIFSNDPGSCKGCHFDGMRPTKCPETVHGTLQCKGTYHMYDSKYIYVETIGSKIYRLIKRRKTNDRRENQGSI